MISLNKWVESKSWQKWNNWNKKPEKRSYKAIGLRAKTTDELDDVITQMIETKNTVIADIWVTKEENCFPMIQSGSAHNEMMLSKDQKQDKKSAEKGKILV